MSAARSPGTVGLLHPGAMGAEVGRTLVEAGHEVLWTSAGRSPATRERADDAGLQDAGSLADLLARSDLVLSICPPDAAPGLARTVADAGFAKPFVDANAVAPETAAGIAGVIGSGYVDGGIVGPPPARPGTTRLFLSGDGAESVAGLFAGTRLEARVLAGATSPWAASALKMSYAAWTKGSAALLLAVDRVASADGVSRELHDEWARSQPGLADRLDAARAAATEKGWRWEGEMREIARTFAAAGVPDGFHLAAAEVYADQPRP